MDKYERAERAQRLLEDDFFKEIIEELKFAQINAIINSNRDCIEDREGAYLNIHFLDNFVGHLQGIAAETTIQKKKWKIL